MRCVRLIALGCACAILALAQLPAASAATQPACDLDGAHVVRQTSTTAILDTYAPPSHTGNVYDSGGTFYYGCWKPTERLTQFGVLPNLSAGNDYPGVDLLRIGGPWVALVETDSITVEDSFSSTIVVADTLTGRTYQPPLPYRPWIDGRPPNIAISALALNRCGTLAYALQRYAGLRLPANSELMLWRAHHPPVRAFTGKIDPRSVRVGHRYRYWRSTQRLHRRRIPGPACL